MNWETADRKTAPRQVVVPRRGRRCSSPRVSPEATRDAVSSYARQQGIAAINLPARIMVVKAIPVLGTGKTDYRALTVLVEEGG